MRNGMDPPGSAVLIVDGDEPLPRTAQSALERAGFRVTRVSIDRIDDVTGNYEIGIFPISSGNQSGAEVARSLVTAGRVRRTVLLSGGKAIDLIADLLFAICAQDEKDADE